MPENRQKCRVTILSRFAVSIAAGENRSSVSCGAARCVESRTVLLLALWLWNCASWKMQRHTLAFLLSAVKNHGTRVRAEFRRTGTLTQMGHPLLKMNTENKSKFVLSTGTSHIWWRWAREVRRLAREWNLKRAEQRDNKRTFRPYRVAVSYFPQSDGNVLNEGYSRKTHHF